MGRSAKPLTRREQEVLAGLAKGHLYKEISHYLSISLDTVKKHCKNIYQKLNVRNRTEAANYFNSRKAA
ncbi:MAG: LuxR C-terminal-related transcriptional regulator [Ferruginibacter sp.]|nr:response regulator transcription factor [Chitinophagaceae bacterium]MBU9937246.1 LuxR C-terminal-related transcriptional regulator [Ferruginibacter sp.]HQY12717.1 LuxR C-terminal-related transcriptional regulator [Ferruginibacter sp.]